MSGAVSDLCWLAAPVVNVLWKLPGIRFDLIKLDLCASDVIPYIIKISSTTERCQTKSILYRYFIALREIYQNVCLEVPGNPRAVIFPNAAGVGKYNFSGIPGIRGTNVLVYFPRSNEITVMLHFTRKNA